MPDALLATVSDLGLLVDEELADNDPKAILYLRIASGIVRSHTNQYLSAKSGDTILLSTIDGAAVFLPEFPIIALTSISRRELDGTFTAFASTDFDLDENTGRIQLRRWPAFSSPIWRAVYSHGFADLPEPITNAVLGLASRAWVTPIGVENERVLQRSIKYTMVESGFSGEEEAGLEPYVVPEIR